RLTITALLEEHGAERLVRGRGDGGQRDGHPRLALGLVGAPQTAEDEHEVETGGEVVGPLCERLTEGGDGLREAAPARLGARAIATRVEARHRCGRPRSASGARPVEV